MDENLFGPDDLLPGDIFLIDDFEQPSPTEVSLAVDLTSVTENSGKEIKYTFTRQSSNDSMLARQDNISLTSVDTSSDLTVNFSISGKAQIDKDISKQL